MSVRVFKTRVFNRWARKEGLNDESLLSAVDEIERGLVDADLGGHLIKKRVALGGRGKRAGARMLLAYKVDDKAFFLYGFAKNVRATVRADELAALHHLAKQLLGYTDRALKEAVRFGALIEVTNDD